jgi:hypothetical protein
MSRVVLPSVLSRNSAVRLGELPVEGGLKIRYQTADLGSFERLSRLEGESDEATLRSLARLFRVNILPAHPDIGALALFRDGGENPFPIQTEIGLIYEPACRARYWAERLYLEGELEIVPEGLVCKSARYRDYFESLHSRGMVMVMRQNENSPRFLSVYPRMGLLRSGSRGQIVFNSHFFQMEFSDCDTPWDLLGNPFGLLTLGRETFLPPLFDRDALVLDRRGSLSIVPRSLRAQAAMIGSEVYRHGLNCEFYARPEMARTPIQGGTDLVVAGGRLLGSSSGGGVEIPEGGFVIHISGPFSAGSLDVSYPNEKEDRFAVQVGPAMVVNGKKAEGFTAPMYSKEGVPFPPTVYPLDWAKGRAARIGIGSCKGRPTAIWVAGPDKSGDRWSCDSAGASLSEFADICEGLGFDNAVNLDGGGSAQLCLDGMRCFHVSDRDPLSGDEAERPVPLALAAPF